MNKIINSLFIMVALLGVSENAMAQQEVTDTLLKVKSPSHLVITEGESGVLVNVKGTEGEESYDMSVFTEYSSDSAVQTTKTEGCSECDKLKFGTIINNPRTIPGWSFGLRGLAIGLINPMNQSPVGGLQWSKSFEICWMSCVDLRYSFSKNTSIGFGIGFDWRNYKITTSDRCLFVNDQKGIEWAPYPEGTRGRNSRLKVFSLQLPVLWAFRIPKSKLFFKAGPVLNLNTYGSVKSFYEDSAGNEKEYFSKNVSLQTFTVDLFGSLSYSFICGIYVRYSPMKVMNSPSTLNFQPLSVGVTIGI